MPESRDEPRGDETSRTLDRRRFLLGCTTLAAAAGMSGVSPVNAAQAQYLDQKGDLAKVIPQWVED